VEQADVVAGADQDGVDRIAFGAGEAVAFEQPVALGVADDRFNGAASPQLPLEVVSPLVV
jgi:hypothetical protein